MSLNSDRKADNGAKLREYYGLSVDASDAEVDAAARADNAAKLREAESARPIDPSDGP